MLDTGLIRRVGGGLAYRHALLAEAARADLRDPEGTHLAVALAVEAAAEHGDARGAEVARHLQRAGRDDLAAARWPRAARHARSLGALPEAAAFWAEAVRCDPDDVEARLELAEAYAWSGRTDEFEREWEAVLARLAARRAAGGVVPARAALQDGGLQPGRLARGLPARRANCSARTRPRRCGPGCSSDWPGTRASAGDPAHRDAAARRGGRRWHQAGGRGAWPRSRPPG